MRSVTNATTHSTSFADMQDRRQPLANAWQPLSPLQVSAIVTNVVKAMTTEVTKEEMRVLMAEAIQILRPGETNDNERKLLQALSAANLTKFRVIGRYQAVVLN